MTTKQHFIQTARIIRNMRQHNADQYNDPKAAFDDPEINKFFRTMATAFADEYENENERFDRAKFITACGFEPEDDHLEQAERFYNVQ